jgi:hypothetical protein
LLAIQSAKRLACVQLRAGLHEAGGLDVPAQALLRKDQVHRRARLLDLVRAELERDADRELARARLLAGLGARVHVLRDVLVQRVHVLPAFGIAHVLQPGGHVEIAGAAGGRVRHRDGALVDRLGQVLPGLGLGQAELLRLDAVEADGRGPDVHADPGRWARGVGVGGVQVLEALGLIGKEHAFLLQQREAAGGQAGHHVGLRVGFFGQQLGGDDAGGVAHPLHLDVGIGLLEGVLVELHGVGLQRRVDQERRLLRPCTAGHEAEGCNTQGRRETARAWFHRHLFLLRGLAVTEGVSGGRRQWARQGR